MEAFSFESYSANSATKPQRLDVRVLPVFSLALHKLGSDERRVVWRLIRCITLMSRRWKQSWSGVW
jgi:hypothetical protein